MQCPICRCGLYSVKHIFTAKKQNTKFLKVNLDKWDLFNLKHDKPTQQYNTERIESYIVE
jgi:predicted nucleic-acid-binding Zn-ribbon protein